MIVFDVVYLNQNNELCFILLHIRPAGIGGGVGKFEKIGKIRNELGISTEELTWLLTDGASNIFLPNVTVVA
jgi:hypothetical protein